MPSFLARKAFALSPQFSHFLFCECLFIGRCVIIAVTALLRCSVLRWVKRSSSRIRVRTTGAMAVLILLVKIVFCISIWGVVPIRCK